MLTTVGRIIYNDRIERALAEALGRRVRRREVRVRQPVDEEARHDAAGRRRSCRPTAPPTIALVLDAFKDLGFKYATQAGITISKNDVVVPPSKEEILGGYEGEVAEIQDQYDMGLITQEERHEAVVEKWNAATDEVAEAMEDNLDRRSTRSS